MSSIAILPDGTLALNGTPMPQVTVVAMGAGDGSATIDSQQHEGGSASTHDFDGWKEWTLRLDLVITEEVDGGRARYDDLAALRAAQRKFADDEA